MSFSAKKILIPSYKKRLVFLWSPLTSLCFFWKPPGVSLPTRPVHCSVSAWTSWSACSEACGSGVRSRERHEVIAPNSLGRFRTTGVGYVGYVGSGYPRGKRWFVCVNVWFKCVFLFLMGEDVVEDLLCFMFEMLCWLAIWQKISYWDILSIEYSNRDAAHIVFI